MVVQLSEPTGTEVDDQIRDGIVFAFSRGPIGAIAERLGRFWWVLLAIGVLWIVAGFSIFRFDDSTATVISVVLGVMVLISAAIEVVRGVLTRARWRSWYFVFAGLLMVGAVTVFLDPDGTFLYLSLVVGFYFVIAGTLDVVASLFAVSATPAWWLQLTTGAIQIVLGYFASSSYESGATLLVTYVSISALFRGVSDTAAAFAVRAHVTLRQQ